MAYLKTTEKNTLENLFQMERGRVLDFSYTTMHKFFKDELDVNIYNRKYEYASCSQTNHLLRFWRVENEEMVGRSILKLIEYIEGKISSEEFEREDYPKELILEAKNIAYKLLGKPISTDQPQTTFPNNKVDIFIQEEIFEHIHKLLNDRHYSSAVEEAYKVVRKKLQEITGKEKATDAFDKANYEKIFGYKVKNKIEEDFFEGVKFLHMAIQFFRNEKAHSPAKDIDKDLAIHYIALASLAYKFITTKTK